MNPDQRITAALLRYNDVAEGEYPRIFDRNFDSLPRQQWNTTTYSIEMARK